MLIADNEEMPLAFSVGWVLIRLERHKYEVKNTIYLILVYGFNSRPALGWADPWGMEKSTISVRSGFLLLLNYKSLNIP
jgi:hypothetical protein